MMVRTRTFVCAGIVAVALTLAATAPGQAFLDKTRFVAHLGVAYFAFHHWVMRPYEAGAFNDGAPHRTSTIVKGGLALLFAVHEVRVSQKIAADSHDPLLEKVNGAVSTMGDTFASVGQRFKSGNFSPGDVASLSSTTGTLSSLASAAGINIKDKAVPIPGV